MILFVCYLTLFSLEYTSATERHYYIATVEIDWDYTPRGNLVSNDHEQFNKQFSRGMDRIGSKYRKVIYREFTGPSFTKLSPTPRWQGMLGPTIRAQVGDVVYIHFRNLATIGNFSVHPHGLFYTKSNEGALYLDGTGTLEKQDDRVPPGGTVTYIWHSAKLHAPTDQDDNCVAWGYHSHTNSVKDIDTGTAGFIINCRKGYLDSRGRRIDVSKEFPLYVDVADEQKTYFTDLNMHRCGNPVLCKRLKEQDDAAFRRSNEIKHINGRSYGNLSPYVAYEGEKVVWYVMSLNLGIHTMHVNGQTMVVNKKRQDTVMVASAVFYSSYMEPVNQGRWLVYCRNQQHYTEGMSAFLQVKSANRLPPKSLYIRQKYSRIYYIAIEEILWNYTPYLDKMTLMEAARFVQRGNQRIGSVYKKAVYREYTDMTFTKRKVSGPREEHYGLAGPPIRAETGERVKVFVMNKASRTYSLLLNGVSITKKNEGAYYKNSPFSSKESGAIVPPGTTRKYIFSTPVDTLLPLNDDCKTYVYHSAVNLNKDIHTGLFGPLLICKQGVLSSRNKLRKIDREFFLNWGVIDENLSWYLDDNIQMFIKQPWTVNKTDNAFKLSNQMRAINGYSFGSIKGLRMCLGQRVKWHMYGIGGGFDHHHFSFEGNNFLHQGKKVDSGSVFPGLGVTVTMIPDQAGRLLFRTGQLGYESEGMYGFYNVLVCVKKPFGKILPPRILPSPNGVVRRYFIGIIEVDWEYTPIKRDGKTGASLLEPKHPGYSQVRGGPIFVGSKYIKSVYRQFTDKSFTKMVPRFSRDKHLGMVGPFIRGNVGDVIEIVLKNMASFPYNLVPRNVVFKDGSPISDALPTYSGKINVYRYVIPERSSPLPSQPNCVGSIYSSRVNPLNDTNSGLFGPLIICKAGILDIEGRRTDKVNREFALGFLNIDENLSNYKGVNFALRAPQRRDYSDPKFRHSNMYHSINGYIFGNAKGFVMKEGEMSAWYVFAFGSAMSVHSVHFHGQLYVHVSSLTMTRDVLEIWPGTYETIEMAGYNPGTWLLHCHLGRHARPGMVTTYTVLPNPNYNKTLKKAMMV
ncbi:hypothetical protein ACF0H5_003419 [Mactra antiquata]